MGKTWILDSETKGTGAVMVPLNKAKKLHKDKPLQVVQGISGRPAPKSRPRLPTLFMAKTIYGHRLKVKVQGAELVRFLATVNRPQDIQIFAYDRKRGDWFLVPSHDSKLIWRLVSLFKTA